MAVQDRAPYSRQSPATLPPLDDADPTVPNRWSQWRAKIPVVGVALVLIIIGIVVAVSAVTAAGQRQPVLASIRDLPAGYQLVAGDIQVVEVAADPDIPLIPADQLRRVVGSQLAVPVSARSLLTNSQLGTPMAPAKGDALVAVRLDAGQFPPTLAAGDHVTVVLQPADPTGQPESAPTGNDADGTQPNTTVPGPPRPETLDQVVVISVVPIDTSSGSQNVLPNGRNGTATDPRPPLSGGAVVTLDLPQAGAIKVASASGIRLVAVRGGS